MCIDKTITESALTHSRPEPEGEQPTERTCRDVLKDRPLYLRNRVHGTETENIPSAGQHVYAPGQPLGLSNPCAAVPIFTPEQEKARQEAKAGKLGIKFDGQKLRWDLLPYREVEQVVDILTYGAEKYADGNWMQVPENRKRYFAAAMRHLTKWFMGERLDEESGRNHLAHALCCILFLLWKDNENTK